MNLLQKPSVNFDEKLTTTIHTLKEAANAHSHIKLASSLGAEDMVLGHLVETLRLPIHIFVLNTGKLHVQTLDLLAQIQREWRSSIEVYEPNTVVTINFVNQHGQDAMYQSLELRKACCHMRKVEPLEKALLGVDAWVVGLRREQSSNRADVPVIENERPGRFKYSPLADWTAGDVWHYIKTYCVPYNPLHDAFYPSIGCEPCTRAVTLGEDPRSGRWWWEASLEGGTAKECGLHVRD